MKLHHVSFFPKVDDAKLRRLRLLRLSTEDHPSISPPEASSDQVVLCQSGIPTEKRDNNQVVLCQSGIPTEKRAASDRRESGVSLFGLSGYEVRRRAQEYEIWSVKGMYLSKV